MKRFRDVLFLIALLLPATLYAVPSQLEYQGYLTDVAGTPIDCQGCSTPYTFHFSLYDDAITGEPLWTESHVGVDIVNGMFRVALGSNAELSPEHLIETRWLEIQVNSQAPMIPRQELVSVPYALRAAVAEEALEATNAVSLGGLDVDSFVQVADTAPFLMESELETILADLGYIPGDNDTLAEMISCEVNQILRWDGSAWTCGLDNDSQLSESQVDAMVDNNGLASQTDLETLQSTLLTVQANITSLQDAISTAEDTLVGLQTNAELLQTSIAEETAARTATDTNLQAHIDAEALNRDATDTLLQANIDAEVLTRSDADTLLQTQIDNESATRAATDTLLQTNIDAEILSRSDADTLLQTKIDEETLARVAADDLLQNDIDVEKVARADTDTALQASIDLEIVDRTASDLALQADIDAAGLPTGSIILWSGSVGSIPTGWGLCDGSDGTPDLRNRFVMGAGDSYSPGNTGGSFGGPGVSKAYCAGFGSNGVSVVTGVSHGNTPPYYALAYIMKL